MSEQPQRASDGAEIVELSGDTLKLMWDQIQQARAGGTFSSSSQPQRAPHGGWSYKVHPHCCIIFQVGADGVSREVGRVHSAASADFICEMCNATPSGADVREARHESPCDCYPWPDKCPYCGGQPDAPSADTRPESGEGQ